jgi:C1A family cysteine protease
MSPIRPTADRVPDAPPLEPRKVRRYGWRPDTPDLNDRPFNHRARLRAIRKLPRFTENAAGDAFAPVLDQDDLGACTANAIAKLYAFQHARQGLPSHTPSRLFIYYGEREMEGTVNVDAGAEIRDGLKVVSTLGAPAESIWPYSIGRFTERPPALAYEDGLNHQALAYESVPVTQKGVMTALATGHPVVVGFTVYESFHRIGRDGFMPIPRPGERVEGGHAVLVVDYAWLRGPGDTRKKCYALVLNSWGPNWGKGGYFYMPMAWLCNKDNADDFWTITIAEG